MNPTLAPVLEQLRGRLIVSVQAEIHEPFYPIPAFDAMVRSVLNGGAAGLRLAGGTHIRHVRKHYPNVPVIGITKPAVIPEDYVLQVYITPTYQDVESVAKSGASVVALDATQRPRPQGEKLSDIVRQARKNYPTLGLMADVATAEEGLRAEALGFDLLSTTLSGYTAETATKKTKGSDFELLSLLLKETRRPVILEGRIWTPEEVQQAFDLGAFAVVIGSAITRPHQITQRFALSCPLPGERCGKIS